MSFIAVICGLKSEAAAVSASVGASKIRVGISGADAGRAYKLVRAACQDGTAAVISVGVSGGLDPALTPGDLVIGDRVITDDGANYEADKYLLSAMNSSPIYGEGVGGADGRRAARIRTPSGPTGHLPRKRGRKKFSIATGPLFGSDTIVQSAEHKAALFREHGAIAVDMESHGAARAAAEAGVPFLAIRAIADPASRALPKAALNAVAPDGSTRVFATLLEMTKAPGDIPALLQLGSDSEKALRTLRRDLGPFFDRLFLALDL